MKKRLQRGAPKFRWKPLPPPQCIAHETQFWTQPNITLQFSQLTQPIRLRQLPPYTAYGVPPPQEVQEDPDVGSGVIVYETTLYLAQWFASQPDLLGQLRGSNILELGSGTGALGISLNMLRTHTLAEESKAEETGRMVLTDHGGTILGLLEANAEVSN
jgi:hypothetical protein